MNASTLLCAGAALAGFVLAGCAVGPDYHRPAVEAPAFKETGDWKPAEPADQLPRGKWWQVYGDSALDGLEDRIEISSTTLQVAEAQFREAQAAATIAASALFPSVDVNGSADRARTAARPPFPGRGRQHLCRGAGGKLGTRPVGSVRRSAQAGRAAAEASAADLESARLSARALLAQTYFSLRVAESQEDLYARLVEDYTRFLKITQNRYAQGVDTRADVAAAETQLKSAQAQAIDYQLQRASSSMPSPCSWDSRPPPSPFREPVSQAGPRRRRRWCPRNSSNAARTSRARNAGSPPLAPRSAWPRAAISRSFRSRGARLPGIASRGLLSSPNEVWSLGGSALMPLFDAGKTRAEVAQARAAYDASLATYRQTVLAAFQEVEDNLAAAGFLAREVEVQNEAVAAARQSTAIALNQYQAGTVTYWTS